MDLTFPGRNEVMTRCEDGVLVFCAMDASYMEFDRPGIELARKTPNTVTRAQVELMNKFMRARSSYEAWAERSGRQLCELAELPEDADLVEMPDDDWAKWRSSLEKLYERLIGRGIGATAATKIAYLHRPCLIAMADREVSKFFSCEQDPAVPRAMKVADEIRKIGRCPGNLEALRAIQDYLRERTLDGKPIELSKVRILDALIWMKQRRFGQLLWEALRWGPL